jgi:hypothetical protein
LSRSFWFYLVFFVCALPGAANADACYDSSVVSPAPFLGNNDEIVKLADGSVWEVKYEYAYLYAYYPKVTVCPGRGKLIIENTELNVQQVSHSRSVVSSQSPSGQSQNWAVFEETSIRAMVSGVVQQGSIFKTLSGNVYEVTGPTAQAVALVQPAVMVMKSGDVYKLRVEGFSEYLICRKLN